MPECVHHLDFDKLEIVMDRKRKYKIRTGCTKCGTAVTLDHVFESLVRKINDLQKRVKALEGGEEHVDEPVPGPES